MQHQKFPSTFPNIIGNEFAERFSYYGYRALITLFLMNVCSLTPEMSKTVTYSNIALTYTLTVLGGLVADWFLGRYKTILYFSLLCCLGHFLLSFFIQDCNMEGIKWSLFLIGAGAGFIKPNTSALLGDQFFKPTPKFMEKAFHWFYFSINCGSLLAYAFIPLVKEWYGYEVAFAVPGVLMVLATLLLFAGRKKYVHIKPTGIPKFNFVGVNMEAVGLYLKGKKNIWKHLENKYSVEKIDAILAVWRVIGIFIFIPLSWSLYDFSGPDYIIDAELMNRNFYWFTLEPEQIPTVNSVFILILIPLSFKVYPRIEKKLNIELTAKRKLLIGFIFVLIATLFEGLLKELMATGYEIHVSLQIGVYLILTIGEVMFSITGLEYGYTHAPKTMKSTVMSIWLLTAAVGAIITAHVSNLMEHNENWFFLKEGGNFYWFFCLLFLINIVLYFFFSKRMKEKTYL